MKNDCEILGPVLPDQDKTTEYIMRGCIIASIMFIAAVATFLLTYNTW